MTSVGSRPGKKPATGAKGKGTARGVAGPRNTSRQPPSGTPRKPPKPVPAPRRRPDVKDSHDRYANIEVQG